MIGEPLAVLKAALDEAEAASGMLTFPDARAALAQLPLTAGERAVANHLATAWNEFLELPGTDPDSREELRRAINTGLHLLALRVARRLEPAFWVTSSDAYMPTLPSAPGS
jgi:hypothetical protein